MAISRPMRERLDAIIFRTDQDVWTALNIFFVRTASGESSFMGEALKNYFLVDFFSGNLAKK